MFEHSATYVPYWFTRRTRICYRWRADGNSGQCRTPYPWTSQRFLCATPGHWTRFYIDDTDGRPGGCRMQWGILSSGPRALKYSVHLCYRFEGDGDTRQCGARSRVVCAPVGRLTPVYRDDTDGRSGGCRMSWMLSVRGYHYPFLRNLRLCFNWSGGVQCGGRNVGRTLCARTNRWTSFYRDDTDNRSGGRAMRWGVFY